MDNIIPSDDPTFEIYRKLNWQPFHEVACGQGKDKDDAYMIYIPPARVGKDLRDSIVRLVHHIRRRRPAIDMRDNEIMVQRTIEEFKDLYRALLAYFSDQKDSEENDSLKRFMFTRYVTKLLGFKRRISQLLGYTGGESMEQIPLIALNPETYQQSHTVQRNLKTGLVFFREIGNSGYNCLNCLNLIQHGLLKLYRIIRGLVLCLG